MYLELLAALKYVLIFAYLYLQKGCSNDDGCNDGAACVNSQCLPTCLHMCGEGFHCVQGVCQPECTVSSYNINSETNN